VKLDSLVFGIAGVCFGLIVGWVLGSQQAARSAAVTPAAAEQSASASTTQTNQPAPPSIDQDRVRSLQDTAKRDPKNVEAHVQLGNLYFDGERCDQAIPWYEAALKLDAKNVNVSTDLGMCYYQTNQPDKALQQFDRSLKLDPKHVKTLLNLGIVRAFGKKDLEGAANSWKQVVELAPDSQEAELAKRGLEGIAAARQKLNGSIPSPGVNK
jgi:cytochrome c-type biogenesis protein CcmH/NrfG